MSHILKKIEERRRKIRDREDKNKPLYYSFEYFPPKTEAGLDNLLSRIDRMTSRLDPLFVDVTWGSSGSTAARTMAVASHAQRFAGTHVLLHLTCSGMSRSQLEQALNQAKAGGICNILALRGDPPRSKRSWKIGDVSGSYCARAIDLVRFIKNQYGDYFCIAVAGHPEGHPSSVSPEAEIKHLKEKIDAGADFIMTQFFYDTNIFLEFLKACREAKIDCPILPGIMPIQSYSSFIRMTDYCNISVPGRVMERLEPVKDDDEAIKEIGVEIAVEMCQTLLSASENEDYVDGIHFYTLNLERSVTQILLKMGAIDIVRQNEDKASLNNVVPTDRPLPWRPSTLQERSKEEIRPINWANRPASYVMRTETWDEFPNGRWGDATSPAFGELSEVSHFYNFSILWEDRIAMLGARPKRLEDVYEVFAKYVEGTVTYIPWCETPLQPESFLIQSQLVKLNQGGFLTINSQPSVNGIPSSNSTFGWGGRGGYVYQKAYVECFVSPENAEKLLKTVNENSSMNLYGINSSGKEINAGISEGGTTALTWGVFPNREIVQPTVFDPQAFRVWAEEAFSLWTNMWLDLYEPGTDSYELIETVRDTFFLVAIIDNDFVSKDGAIWRAMFPLADIEETT